MDSRSRGQTANENERDSFIGQRAADWATAPGGFIGGL